jgi:hypothetical protein
MVRLFEEHFIESQEEQGMRVVGQFRDLDRPDRFVWIRGFDDMESRGRALEAFYGGPVWKEHRDAANATMIDSDNVLLLRPVAADAGFLFDPGQRPKIGGHDVPAGVVVATIHYFPGPVDAAFVSWFDSEVCPLLANVGTSIVAQLVTESAPNRFRLPVREGVNVFVWFSAYPDEPAYRAVSQALEALPEWKSRVEPRLAAVTTGEAERLVLAPTSRSALRYDASPAVTTCPSPAPR